MNTTCFSVAKKISSLLGVLFFTTGLLIAADAPTENSTPELIHLTGRTMGTVYGVSFYRLPPTLTTNALTESLNQLFLTLDREMSTYRPDSEISRFSDYQSTNWFPVSKETAFVIEDALRVSRLSQGAFDITVAPLVQLWGFGPDRHTGQIPSETAIASTKRKVGYTHLEARLNPPALRKDIPELAIDLGGIGKGYGADAMAQLLDSLGVTDYLVNIGGETKAKGNSHFGRPWHVGVEKPVENVREIERVVALANQGMSTSGDYRNFFFANGQRYAHIIDPHTGHPVTNGVAAACIIQSSTMHADALAKTFIVMGPEAGYRFAVEQHFPVLMIIRTDKGFVEKMTPEFEKLVVR